MNKYKKGDKVRVLQGKDRGREGNILKLFPKKGTALVEGINIYKKHIKPQLTQDGKGGIFDLPRPMKLSKLAVIDPKTKKRARIGFKLKSGTKVRINKKTGKAIDGKTKSKK